MKHLKLYESVSSKKRGYLFYFFIENTYDLNGSCWVPVISDNFIEAASKAIENFCDFDDIKEFHSYGEFVEAVEDYLNENSGGDPEFIIDIYTDLTPKVDSANENISIDNPVFLIEEFEKYFSGVVPSLKRGAWDSANGPGKGKYDIPLLGDLDEMISYYSKNPQELNTLDEFPEFKEKVIKATGIKDISRLGRNIKNGLI